MRTPKFSTKRVLGLALAAALAVTGTVSLASTSDAATVTNPAATLSPTTGSASGGTTVAVKGKGFADSTGAVVVAKVAFQATACTVVATGGTAATSYNVVSATKLLLTSPALAAGTWYLCIWDGTTVSSNILGQGTFVTAAGPTATTILPTTAGGLGISNASVLGGSVVSLAGTNFDKTSKATIDNLPAKTKLVSTTKLSITLPAHTAATGLKISISSMYGTTTSTDTVSYVPVVGSVSPSVGDGVVGNVVTLTGVGFNSYTFGAAAGNQEVVFVPGGTTWTLGAAGTGTTVPATVCTAVLVESDKSLNCQAPALTGAYSVAIVTLDATAAVADVGSTVLTRNAIYVAADF